MILGIVFMFLAGFLAHRKGYAWWAWFLSSAVGCFALIFFPYVKDPQKPADPAEAERLRKKGNYTGLALSVALLVANTLLQFLSAGWSPR